MANNNSERREDIRLKCIEHACELGMAHGTSVVKHAKMFERYIFDEEEE